MLSCFVFKFWKSEICLTSFWKDNKNWLLRYLVYLGTNWLLRYLVYLGLNCLYHLPTKLQEGNIFSLSVILFTGIHVQGPALLWPPSYTVPRHCNPGYVKTCLIWTSPYRDTTLVALKRVNYEADCRQVGSWHSTEMPSCYRPQRSCGKALADPRGAPGTRAPPGVQILSFSCSFRQKNWKIIALLGVGAPPGENPGSATAR